MAWRSLPGSTVAVENERADSRRRELLFIRRKGGGDTTPERERPSRILSGGVTNFPAPVLPIGNRPSYAGNPEPKHDRPSHHLKNRLLVRGLRYSSRKLPATTLHRRRKSPVTIRCRSPSRDCAAFSSHHKKSTTAQGTVGSVERCQRGHELIARAHAFSRCRRDSN